MRPTHRLLATLLGASALVAAVAPPAASAPAKAMPRASHRAESGRVVVGFDAGTPATARKRAVAGARARRVGRVGALNVEVLESADVAVTLARLGRHSSVRWVQRQVVAQRLAELTSTPERDELRVKPAHDAAGPDFSGAGIRVGVIDDGVWRTPDLGGLGDEARLVDGGDCSDGDCSQGLGINSPTFSAGAHGTAVATLIAAADNDAGIIGVAPLATVYSYRVFPNAEEGASDAAIAAAILKAAAQDMHVVNLSLGTPVDSFVIREAIKSARASDPLMVIVAAAGNDGTERASYPAGNPGVLSVGASECVMSTTGSATVCDAGDTRRVAKFSTAGDVDVLGPGVGIRAWYAPGAGAPKDPATESCTATGASTCINGTSFAAPQIAGVLAGLAAKGVRGDEARAAVMASARRTTSLNGRARAAGGYGRADARAAYDLTVGTAAYSVASFERGAFVPRGVGRRQVEVLRVDPQPAAGVNGPATLLLDAYEGTARAGTTTFEDDAVDSVGDRVVPARGTRTYRRHYFYRPPRVHSGRDFEILVGAPGEKRKPLAVSLLEPTGGPEGKPIPRSLPTTRTKLTYGTASSVLYEVALSQGETLRVTFRYPTTSLGSFVEVWLPEAATPGSLGASDAPYATEDSDPPVFSGTWNFVAPVTGRYTFGVQLLHADDSGEHDLAATVLPA